MLHREIHARVGVPPGEATLPPLGDAPEWAEPIKTRFGGFRDGHWVGFLFLVPFVVMFVLHEPLGMTDAFLMGDRVSADYNLMTFASLFLGSDVVLQGTRSGHPSAPLGQILSKLRRHGLGTNYPVSGSGPRSIRSPASRRVRERQCVAV
jgi:hypothetical protein